MTPNNSETVEQVREVASYRRTPEPLRSQNYPYNESTSTTPVDFEHIVNSLALRIDTLQKSGCRVLVSCDGNYLKLSTVIRVAAPKPETPSEPEAATKPAGERKRRRLTRRSASRG